MSKSRVSNINFYQAIFDKCSNAIFYTDSSLNIIECNTAAVKILGYSLKELIKMDIRILLDNSDLKLFSLLNNIGKEDINSVEAVIFGKNRHRIDCELSTTVHIDEFKQNYVIITLVDLTERKAFEKNLLARQELLNAVVDESNDGIAVTDIEGHFVIFNQTMIDLLGVEPIDSKTYDWGKEFKIYYKDGEDIVATPDLPIVRALKGERLKDEIYLVKNPKKGNLYLSISASPIKDRYGAIKGSLVVDRDITNQHLDQTNLKLANLELTDVMTSLVAINERFKYVLKATNDAIWDLDLKTYDIQWGEGYEKLFGYKMRKNEGTYEAWQSKIHPDDLERVKKSIEIAITEKRSTIWESEYRYFKNDKSVAYVYDRGHVIFDNANYPIRMVGAMQDITQRRQHETERTQLIDELLQRNKNLEQFTYIISHNLRSPVANIIGCAEMLKENDLTNEERERFMEGLSVSIRKLDEVITDLHTILQIKSDISESRQLVNLIEVFDDVTNNIVQNVNVHFKYDFEVTEVNTVKSLFYSIFLNLISNSIKYRRDDRQPIIEVSSAQNGNLLYLTFKDNGMGIDLATNGQELFGLYKRFHSHVEGKGLGLFMVKTQIEMMKGNISVKSNLNEGIEFTITIPMTN